MTHAITRLALARRHNDVPAAVGQAQLLLELAAPGMLRWDVREELDALALNELVPDGV